MKIISFICCANQNSNQVLFWLRCLRVEAIDAVTIWSCSAQTCIYSKDENHIKSECTDTAAAIAVVAATQWDHIGTYDCCNRFCDCNESSATTTQARPKQSTTTIRMTSVNIWRLCVCELQKHYPKNKIKWKNTSYARLHTHTYMWIANWGWRLRIQLQAHELSLAAIAPECNGNSNPSLLFIHSHAYQFFSCSGQYFYHFFTIIRIAISISLYQMELKISLFGH